MPAAVKVKGGRQRRAELKDLERGRKPTIYARTATYCFDGSHCTCLSDSRDHKKSRYEEWARVIAYRDSPHLPHDP